MKHFVVTIINMLTMEYALKETYDNMDKVGIPIVFVEFIVAHAANTFWKENSLYLNIVVYLKKRYASRCRNLNTSFIERINATDRIQNTRKMRKSLRFSKNWEMHNAMTYFIRHSAPPPIMIKYLHQNHTQLTHY